MKPQKTDYMFDPEVEAMPRPQLAALQLEKLKKIVRHAYENVAHYKKSFDAAGVKPDDLKSLEDFHRFPFTEKNDLRGTANMPNG